LQLWSCVLEWLPPEWLWTSGIKTIGKKFKRQNKTGGKQNKTNPSPNFWDFTTPERKEKESKKRDYMNFPPTLTNRS
jgi:hypothetical protein